MGTTAQKLNYAIQSTNEIADRINYLGGNITSDTELADFKEELDTIYDNLPKVTGTGSNITLYPTLEGRIDSTLNGQIGQDGTPTLDNEIPVKYVTSNNTIRVRGKQLFDNDDTPIILGSNTIQKIDTGIRVTATASSANQFAVYKLMDLTNYVGKVARMKADFVASSENLGSIKFGVCSADGSTRQSKTSTSVSGTTIYFTIPSDLGNNKYLAVWLYSNNNGTAVANDYVDYTNIVVTIDNTDMTYEPYYTSQEKPLNLGNLEVYENGYFSKENGKWYLNNEYKTIIEKLSFLAIGKNDIYYSAEITDYATSQNIPVCNFFKGINNVHNAGDFSATTSNQDDVCGFTDISGQRTPRFYIKCTTMDNTQLTSFFANNDVKLTYKTVNPSKTEITDTTLINQLEEIYKLMSYADTTIIETECEVGNMPIIINAKALLDSEKKLHDLETRIEILESEE